MKIFLDSANVAELREGVAMGLVDGCTTNPSLIAKEKRPFRPLVEEICRVVPGDVSLEVVATDFDGMVATCAPAFAASMTWIGLRIEAASTWVLKP